MAWRRFSEREMMKQSRADRDDAAFELGDIFGVHNQALL